ncbi:kelch-like protein 3 isoform X2 [Myzus persicae]|uniref:kelch-like protein 3 isoform X2 n=1 Tax=Myzus persicae TaxID=13164 RepID=UPI000B931A48|nr:kelch-like protein 3 isoform X2 [Myzus persicae]
MDSSQTSSCESDLKQVMKSEECAWTNFRNTSHSVRILQGLQFLLKNEALCDIKFKTDDGCITFGHKNVLMAASPYFHAMFSNYFNENKNDFVSLRKLDSNVLQLLIDYIYTGEILVTKKNVQVLLPAANYLQLDFVTNACVDFLQKQLDVSNCLDIRVFADLHNCTELLSSSETFIKKKFLDVVKGDEFLFLSSEDVIKIISYNDLAVTFEEKVFESVIKWVNHDLDLRKDFLPDLMEHVRLPLINLDTLFTISEEPLLNTNPKCKDYLFEAVSFNLRIAIPQTIRCKPRQFGGSQKVILMFKFSCLSPKCTTEWYDLATKIRKNGPEINDCHKNARFVVIRNQWVFALGGVNQSVSLLNLSSQSHCWVPMTDMLVVRRIFGVCVLDDCIYVVGGSDGLSACNSVEVFDISKQKWRMVSSMLIARRSLGVGVLNNCLYAVGGANSVFMLKSVERYDLRLDEWTPVPEMSVCRSGPGIAVLDGVMYVIGGFDGLVNLKSAEIYRPDDEVWTSISDMHVPRRWPDGLLYVIGGDSEEIIEPIVQTVEIYDPRTNTWTMDKMSSPGLHIFGGVAVDRPPHVITNENTI